MGFRVILSLAVIPCSVMGVALKDSSEALFPLNSSDIMNGPMRCLCSPTNRGYPREALDIMQKGVNDLVKAVQNVNIYDQSEVQLLPENLELAVKNCFKKFGTESCINADKKLREGGKFYCMHEMKNGKNVYPNKNHQLVTVGPCDTNIKTSSTDTQLDDPLNEGCVDVAHLKGYYKLHRYDLKRRVLCVPELDFCATANHALLVDDTWTSLKKLCTKEGWECTEEERMVNNLNALFRTRLRFNDRIVITPYDVSWPIFATIIGQVIELTWNVALKIVHLILVFSLLLVAHGILATNGHLSLTGTTPLETVISKTPRGVQKFANHVFDSFAVPPSPADSSFANPLAGSGLLARSPRVVQNVCQFGNDIMAKIRGNAEIKRIEDVKPEETPTDAPSSAPKPAVPDVIDVDAKPAGTNASISEVKAAKSGSFLPEYAAELKKEKSKPEVGKKDE